MLFARRNLIYLMPVLCCALVAGPFGGVCLGVQTGGGLAHFDGAARVAAAVLSGEADVLALQGAVAEEVAVGVLPQDGPADEPLAPMIRIAYSGPVWAMPSPLDRLGMPPVFRGAPVDLRGAEYAPCARVRRLLQGLDSHAPPQGLFPV